MEAKKTVLDTVKAVKAGKNSKYILLAKNKEINKRPSHAEYQERLTRNQHKEINRSSSELK